MMRLVAAMSDEFTSTFEKLWGSLRSQWCDCHDLEGALALSHDDVKTEFFHRVVQIKVDGARVDRLIDDAIQYFQTKDFPCAFTLSPLDRPASFADRLMHRGFVRGKQASAMVCRRPDERPTINCAVAVDRLTEDEYETWTDLVCRLLLEKKNIGTVGRSVLIAPETRLYLARVDGDPVGTTLLHSRFDMGYIDFVGALPEWRRKGVASALVRHAVVDSLELGNRWTALEVVSGGNTEQLYRRLGFHTVHHRQRYTAPSAGE